MAGVVAALLGVTAGGVARAETPGPTATGSLILNLTNRPVETPEQAFNQAIKADAQAPAPSSVDQWEPQPDGSMRHKKTGVSIAIRNPCPPGDFEHEAALAAYNRAQAPSKTRR